MLKKQRLFFLPKSYLKPISFSHIGKLSLIAQMIVEDLVSGVEAIGGGDQPLVILMHVNAGTGAVLPQIIDYLAAQGYSFAAYNPEGHFSMNFWKDNRL